jgi:hypothetical protein
MEYYNLTAGRFLYSLLISLTLKFLYKIWSVFSIAHFPACALHISCLQTFPGYFMSLNQPDVTGMSLYSSSCCVHGYCCVHGSCYVHGFVSRQFLDTLCHPISLTWLEQCNNPLLAVPTAVHILILPLILTWTVQVALSCEMSYPAGYLRHLVLSNGAGECFRSPKNI